MARAPGLRRAVFRGRERRSAVECVYGRPAASVCRRAGGGVSAPHRPRVYLDRLESGYLPPIQAGLDWIGLSSKLRWGDTVFIKPNLTFPVFRKGVMTNPQCLEDVVIALRDYTDRIIVGEADSGGYNRFSIDHVFDAIGLRDLQRRYGIQIVNLSSHP